MTKNEFIQKVVDKFEIKDLNIEKLSSQLDVYKEFLQNENAKMNLTRLDKDELI